MRSAQARRTILICGTMGQVPFAGMAWQVLHHLEGFRRLGLDVFYVEDTGAWPFDPEQNRISEDCSYAVAFIDRMLAWCGLEGRWAYRAGPGQGQLYGMSEQELAELYGRADILINLTGATRLRGQQLKIPVRVYLETDPVLPEIEIAQGNPATLELLSAHTHHVTYGENIGSPACPLPTGPFRFHVTRPPVIVDWWKTSVPPRDCFTTIGNWRQTGKDIEWNGETYSWSKHHSFMKVLDAPSLGERLELALSSIDADSIKLLTSHGWQVADAVPLSLDIFPYRDYVQSSRGEFTAAKDQNVRLRSGWFSDRSVCYLAAGRPVITENTHIGRNIPTGEGLFVFNTIEEIASAFEAVRSDYTRHSRRASEIASEYFRAETVLAKLLRDIGIMEFSTLDA